MILELQEYALRQFKKKNNGLIQIMLANAVIFIFLLAIRILFRFIGYSDYLEIALKHIYLSSSIHGLITKPWSVFSYFWVQTEFLSIFWDMMLLYTFGNILLNLFNSMHFVIIYWLGGIFSGLFFLLIYNTVPRFIGTDVVVHGMDGCLYAVISATVTLAPDYKFIIFLLNSVKSKYILYAMLFLSFYSLDGENPAISIIQLFGALVGYVYAKYIGSNMYTNKKIYVRLKS